MKNVSLAYGAFGQKGLVCLLDLGYPEGLEDLTDVVGLGGLVSMVCLVSRPNFSSNRLFATIYTIYTSGDVIYEHPLIWPDSIYSFVNSSQPPTHESKLLDSANK